MAVTPLETTITAGPSGAGGSASASFSFSSSEPAGFDCRLDNEAFAACGSPKTYSGLANGLHSFQVRARDAAGNLDPTPATRFWVVNVAGAADTTRPRVSGLRLSRKVFAAAASGPSISRRRAKVGTKVRYRLTERATVRFRILRRKAGGRVRGKCKKRTRANRKRKKCDLRLKGSFKHSGGAGQNSFRFRGRLRGRKLKPGRYYLVATATDAAGNRSTLKRVAFRIVRR